MVHIPILGTPTHCRLPAAPLPHSQTGRMRFPTTTPRFTPRLHGWHRIQALTGTVTLLTEQLGGWNGANLRTANRQFSFWTVATLVITN